MAPRRHLLLLSEDSGLAALLEPLVAEEGGFSLTAAKPAEAENFAQAMPWEAALADGPAALAALGEGFPMPVLLLGGEEGRPLPPGAAATLRKPLRVAELLAALARLAAARRPGEVRLGGRYRLDPAGRWLADSGAAARRVRLTEKEAAILLHLHRAAPRPVAKEELLGEVWGYSPEATTHTLETHVYRLRRKLLQTFDEALVATDRGGYRLAGAEGARAPG